LEEDESDESCWHLTSLTGVITVQGTENVVSGVCLGDSGYQLFKLTGRELRQGRRVKQASQGSYLVVVPARWERDEQQAGIAPATPEPVSLAGHRAHFFDLIGDQSPPIAFRDSSGLLILIGSPTRQFQLVGQQLPDASENQGPLFVGKAPRIRILNGNWHDIRTIVLGEEGQGGGASGWAGPTSLEAFGSGPKARAAWRAIRSVLQTPALPLAIREAQKVSANLFDPGER